MIKHTFKNGQVAFTEGDISIKIDKEAPESITTVPTPHKDVDTAMQILIEESVEKDESR